MAKPVPRLSADEIRQVIDLAWDDQPPFNAVLMRHGLSPGQVVQLLKRELTPSASRSGGPAHVPTLGAEALKLAVSAGYGSCAFALQSMTSPPACVVRQTWTERSVGS